MPEVTVLMAVYNGQRYLAEAIDGILAQSFTDFELLIINDGSTDATRDIVLGYHDPRIVLVDSERNVGLPKSLNRGLQLARGRYIARHDADDVSEPERLASQAAFLRTHPDIALVGSWYAKIDEDGRSLGYRQLPAGDVDIRWAMLFYCPFVHSAVMLNADLLNAVGRYNEDYLYALDYELWDRIAQRFPVANLPQPLVRYREHTDSMTNTYGERSFEGVRLRFSKVARLLDWPHEEASGGIQRSHSRDEKAYGRMQQSRDEKAYERMQQSQDKKARDGMSDLSDGSERGVTDPPGDPAHHRMSDLQDRTARDATLEMLDRTAGGATTDVPDVAAPHWILLDRLHALVTDTPCRMDTDELLHASHQLLKLQDRFSRSIQLDAAGVNRHRKNVAEQISRRLLQEGHRFPDYFRRADVFRLLRASLRLRPRNALSREAFTLATKLLLGSRGARGIRALAASMGSRRRRTASDTLPPLS